jgi:ubiquinone/menaquinone biosynthesis C-methylase UbiE
MSESDQLFDPWPERYDRWFTTPIGSLVKRFEAHLILDLLRPASGETILDAGCGTGIFTNDLLSHGSRIFGLDISLSMIRRARRKAREGRFQPVLGDISALPFLDASFDKAVSITALEFIEDARRAVVELFRVTKRGGVVVVATLNSLSPWAARRTEEAKKGHPLFSRTIFRSPAGLLSLGPGEGIARTAIHFPKEDSPEKAIETELEGQAKGSDTGAFVAVRWPKP